MVLGNEASTRRFAAILSISSNFGFAAQTLNKGGKPVEVDLGSHAGMPRDPAAKLKGRSSTAACAAAGAEDLY